MIIRVIALKLHDPSALETVAAAFRGLVPRIRAVDAVETRVPDPESPLADLVVVLHFASRAALDEYRTDPDHDPVSPIFGPAWSDFLVTDLEV